MVLDVTRSYCVFLVLKTFERLAMLSKMMQVRKDIFRVVLKSPTC